jgi:antitoxin component YwqK of YwqJK toxin-antitoxin module
MISTPSYERLLLFPNGKPFSGVERIDPNRAILREWTEDGTLTLEAELDANREYNGPYRSWWDNGVPKEEGTFRAGKRVGIYRWYLPSGELWREHDCK